MSGPSTTYEERLRQMQTAARPRGYAAAPGSGPAGETCKTCGHFIRRRSGPGEPVMYRKCGLNPAGFWHGPKTDVRSSSPACEKWEPKE